MFSSLVEHLAFICFRLNLTLLFHYHFLWLVSMFSFKLQICWTTCSHVIYGNFSRKTPVKHLRADKMIRRPNFYRRLIVMRLFWCRYSLPARSYCNLNWNWDYWNATGKLQEWMLALFRHKQYFHTWFFGSNCNYYNIKLKMVRVMICTLTFTSYSTSLNVSTSPKRFRTNQIM